MKRFYNAVCWIGLGILLVFGLAVLLYRAVAIVWLTLWVAFFSSLPWWERILAPVAVVAVMVFLYRRYTGARDRRIPPNQNFVHFTTGRQEESSEFSLKSKGR